MSSFTPRLHFVGLVVVDLSVSIGEVEALQERLVRSSAEHGRRSAFVAQGYTANRLRNACKHLAVVAKVCDVGWPLEVEGGLAVSRRIYAACLKVTVLKEARPWVGYQPKTVSISDLGYDETAPTFYSLKECSSGN